MRVRGAAGEPLLQKSDTDFILYASGVKERHVLVHDGILDPERMTPRIPLRDDSELSVMAEFGVKSARQALDHAGLQAADIDMVICAASHHQRPYPAIAIEIQDALGIAGRRLRHGARLLVGGRGPACRLQPGAHRRTAAHPRRDAGNHHRPSQFPRPPDAFHLRRRLDRDGRGAARRGPRRCRDASRSSTPAAGRSSPTISAPISASWSAPARTTPRPC